VSQAEAVVVVDSFAMLAYLGAEAGHERVLEALELAGKGQVRALLSQISLGEILYITERRRGLKQAQRVLALIDSLPLELSEVTRDLVLDAAHIKASHRLAYADAFVTALAIREGARIMTGDPEFESVAGLVSIDWIVKPG
jgi:uncharacterized protein